MNDRVKELATLLRSGAKMLSEACPICGTPLFEKSGKIWCPTCKREVIKVPEHSMMQLGEIETLLELKKLIFDKIRSLMNDLLASTDLGTVTHITEAIRLQLDTLQKVLDLNRQIMGKKV